MVWEQKLVHVGGSKIRVHSGEPRGRAAERKTTVKREQYGFNYSLRKVSQIV